MVQSTCAWNLVEIFAEKDSSNGILMFALLTEFLFIVFLVVNTETANILGISVSNKHFVGWFELFLYLFSV